MAVDKTSIVDIFNALEAGERLGLKEAMQLVSQSNKLFGGKDAERFFEMARKTAASKPALKEFNSPPFKVSNADTQSLLERISKTHAETVYLDFVANLPLNEILTIVREISKQVTVSAFSPMFLMDLANKNDMKVLELCHEIALAGVSYVPGTMNAHEKDISQIDEIFSVLMMLSKVSIKSSAWLPLSFSDDAKIEQLSRIREFDDRTHTITHVFFHLNTSFSDHDLLKTIAVSRLMLDFSDRLSFVDYQIDYSKTISQKLLKRCVELGINQIGVL